MLYRLNNKSIDLIYLDFPFNSKRIASVPIASKSTGVTFLDM